MLENGYTIHGFRSCFRDWAGDREVIQHALAHQLPNNVERAYRRTKALNKGALLMQAWADYCDGAAESPNVVKLHG